jgi:CheY-like chemotaxis protein
LPVKSLNRSESGIKNDIVESKPFKILIAEDVAMNMLLVKFLLAKLIPHAEIIEAVNGAVAVQKWLDEKPDIILMDMQMPEMDGIDSTLKIRALEYKTKHKTPIIALTAGILKEEREKCFQAGMNDFLTKPIEQEKLFEVIKNYL